MLFKYDISSRFAPKNDIRKKVTKCMYINRPQSNATINKGINPTKLISNDTKKENLENILNRLRIGI